MSDNGLWLRVMRNNWGSRNLIWLTDLKNQFMTIDIFRIIGAMAHVDVNSERLQIWQRNGHSVITDWDQGSFFLISRGFSKGAKGVLSLGNGNCKRKKKDYFMVFFSY